MKNYWGYRINVEMIDFFRSEIECGRLRQGWGYDERQNLRNMSMDGGARRNVSIYNKVKKGDILIVPRLPTWDEVGIVEATEDFDVGYRFEISKTYNDYGHIFPAKLLKRFVRTSQHVGGDLRASIKNISRFWNLGHCAKSIDNLMSEKNTNLSDPTSYEDRFNNSIRDSFFGSFNTSAFSDSLYHRICSNFSNEEWEYGLVEGLKKIFPPPAIVTRVGGIAEINHGTDILIKMPGLLNYQYLIPIQVKDYSGKVDDNAIEQLLKADNYWCDENSKIIDKILIITRGNKNENIDLKNNNKGVTVIFSEELKELITRIGKSVLGINFDDELLNK